MCTPFSASSFGCEEGDDDSCKDPADSPAFNWLVGTLPALSLRQEALSLQEVPYITITSAKAATTCTTPRLVFLDHDRARGIFREGENQSTHTRGTLVPDNWSVQCGAIRAGYTAYDTHDVTVQADYKLFT